MTNFTTILTDPVFESSPDLTKKTEITRKSKNEINFRPVLSMKSLFNRRAREKENSEVVRIFQILVDGRTKM